MTFRERTAIVMLIGSLLVMAWLVMDFTGNGATDLAALATRLLWTVGFAIVFNIVGIIALNILVGIVQGGRLDDDREDERDRAVDLKSMRNGYWVSSASVLGCLLLLALGQPPVVAIYALFGGALLAGLVYAASQLVYYRIG